MSKHQICRVLGFGEGGEGELTVEADYMLELTEVRDDGVVEIAVTIDGKGIKRQRVYIAFSLAELVRLATTKEAQP